MAKEQSSFDKTVIVSMDECAIIQEALVALRDIKLRAMRANAVDPELASVYKVRADRVDSLRSKF